MQTTPYLTLRAFRFIFLLLCGSFPLRAEQSGLFTYRVAEGPTVEITDYPDSAVGPAVIPAVIDGKPVTSIGYGAFSGCSGLTSVTIPSSVTSIGEGAFSECPGLLSIHVDPGNLQYRSVAGVLFNAAQTILIQYPSGMVGTYIIPSSVTTIYAIAFSGCTGLTSVIIPSSVTDIEQYAFSGCTGLTSVTIPSSVIYMSEEAFSYCTGLVSLTISEGVSDLGEYAFSGCTGLTSVTIPSSVTSIAKNVFTGCTGLTSVTISEGVESIEVGSFVGCTGLTDVTIPASVTNIGLAAFSGCIALEAIAVAPENPQYVSVGGVLLNAIKTTLIGFPGGQTGSYTIPSSVTSIGEYAFSGCSGLTSVIIPSSVSNIGDGAFSGCSGLTTLTLPQGLTTIASNLFRGCSGLTTLTIPSGVAAVGYYAFFDCTGLTSVTIPFSVTKIEYSAFDHCTNLTRAIFLGDAPQMDAGTFSHTAPGFTFHYLSGRTGFTSPTWEGYPAIIIDETTYPAASWLLAHGLRHDTDLHTDPNGDGVSLLMAYALDLDPRLNPRPSLPVPVLTGGTLSLAFHASSQGITYRAETSTDLEAWTTAGVIQSAPGADGRSTATVPLGHAHRFLRVAVEE